MYLLLFLLHFFTTVFTAFLAGYPPLAAHVQAEAAISLGAPVQYVTWVHEGDDVEGGGGGRGGGEGEVEGRDGGGRKMGAREEGVVVSVREKVEGRGGGGGEGGPREEEGVVVSLRMTVMHLTDGVEVLMHLLVSAEDGEAF